MQGRWTTDELVEQWTLQPDELALVASTQIASNQLGFALLLKWFQQEGQFPKRKQEVPPAVIGFLAQQLQVDAEAFKRYSWQGRSMERHRAQIRQHLGFREATVQDAEELTQWLIDAVLPHQWQVENNLQEALYTRCRDQRLEPPSPQRIERIIHSALRTADDRFYILILAQLPTRHGYAWMRDYQETAGCGGSGMSWKLSFLARRCRE